MNILNAILCNNDFPVLAQNIGLASLTILIPVAIAIFSVDKEFKELDNHVILDHVIDSKRLLLYLGLIFIPVFFWGHSNYDFRFIEAILWVTGVISICRTFVTSYQWLKGNKFPLRFNYLRKLTDKKDMEESWNSIWKAEKINSTNEAEFFQIYTETINKLF